MAETRAEQPAPRRPPYRHDWILNDTAPDWFRRVWTERSREVPKLSERDLNRMRRIAYL